MAFRDNELAETVSRSTFTEVLTFLSSQYDEIDPGKIRECLGLDYTYGVKWLRGLTTVNSRGEGTLQR